MIIVFSKYSSGSSSKKTTPLVLVLVEETTIGGDIEADPVIDARFPHK